MRTDETISNGLDGTVTVDKGNDGIVDITVRMLQPGNVQIAADGKITVPAGGTVKTGDGEEITLTNGGTVDAAGTVSENLTPPTTPTATPPTNPTATPPGNPPTDKPETPNPGGTVSPEEVKKNSEKLDFGQAVEGADGYDIFAARCGKKLGKKSLIKTVKGEKISVSPAKILGKKLSGKKSYKVRIKAWKYVGGKKTYIGNSRTYHVAGRKHKKYTNAKKLSLAKKKYTLKRGKSVSLKVRIVKQSKKKKLLPKSHGPALWCLSDNKNVASITKKGKVTAKGKGNCYIYVTALNGISIRIKITVK